MTTPISDALAAEITKLRETALALRREMSSHSVRAELDRALRDLVEIPGMFETERLMRGALTMPAARIRAVEAIKASHGVDARVVPTDLRPPRPSDGGDDAA